MSNPAVAFVALVTILGFLGYATVSSGRAAPQPDALRSTMP